MDLSQGFEWNGPVHVDASKIFQVYVGVTRYRDLRQLKISWAWSLRKRVLSMAVCKVRDCKGRPRPVRFTRRLRTAYLRSVSYGEWGRPCSEVPVYRVCVVASRGEPSSRAVNAVPSGRCARQLSHH